MNEIFVTVLCLLWFAEDVTGEYRAICPTQPVEAEEGDDVTLQCRLDRLKDLTDYTLDWGRDDLDEIVYSYRDKKHNHGAQVEGFRNRTNFNLDGLTRGEMTLRISSAQLDDSGPYRCYVPKLNAHCAVNVTVVPKGQLITSKRGGDVSTTRPPGKNVTNIKDGGNTTAIAMSVYLPLVVAVLIIIIIIIIIVGVVARFKCGIIRMIGKMMEKMRGKKAEKEDEENSPEETIELKVSGVEHLQETEM